MYELSWHRDNIIYCHVSQNYSNEEMLECNGKIYEMLDAATHKPIHLVVDVQQISSFPTQLAKIKQSTERIMKHPSFGWMLLLGFDNPLTRFIVNTTAQIAHIKFKHLNSIDEIDHFITTGV